MTEQDTTPEPLRSSAVEPVRSIVGGLLMGVANLVPGVSGGTMLLASGVYPQFIEAVAAVTRFRLRPHYFITLALVGGSALLAILALAGPTRDLVVNQRWIMYSLFIGLTLGGVPIVWRLARSWSAPLILGAVVGLGGMLAIAFTSPGGGGASGSSPVLLFAAGVLGASAMILPGISGGYMLLLLGQYIPVLSAIAAFTGALTADGGPDLHGATSAAITLLPVALGIAVGVLVISNLVQWALVRFKAATLGLLLGLLIGAVAGLWPFQQSVEPRPGTVVKGRIVTQDNMHTFDIEDWPLGRFAPTTAQAGGAIVLVVLGFGLTMLIGRIGAPQNSRE